MTMTIKKNLPARRFMEKVYEAIDSPLRNLLNPELFRGKVEAVHVVAMSDTLANTWNIAKNYTGSNCGGVEKWRDGQDWLANAIAIAYPPAGIVPKAESERWKCDVFQRIEELRRLLRSCPANFVGIEFKSYSDYDSERARPAGWDEFKYVLSEELGVDIKNLEDVKLDNALSHISRAVLHELNIDTPLGVLDRIEKTYNNDLPSEPYWPQRRTGSDGRRAYFVRVLTRGMLGRTGQAKRDMVSNITNQLFNESGSHISINQIIHLTRDITNEPSKFEDLTKEDFICQIVKQSVSILS